MKIKKNDDWDDFYKSFKRANIVGDIFGIILAVVVVAISIIITIKIANSDLPLWLKLYLT